MRDNSRKKEVKHLVYLLLFLWLLNIVVYGYLIYFGILKIQPIIVVVLLPLGLILLVIVGLWRFKKWGLILGYILSISLLIESLISVNIIGLIIWAIILYYLYKYRENFS